MSNRFSIRASLTMALVAAIPSIGWTQVHRASLGAASGELVNSEIRVQLSVGRPLAGAVSNDLLTVRIGHVWPEQLGTVSVGETDAAASSQLVFELGRCSPNPFNPLTVIPYSVAETGPVELLVYSVDGRLVRTLVDGSQEAGAHAVQWNGRSDDGVEVASGIYFYSLRAHGQSSTRRMVLLK